MNKMKRTTLKIAVLTILFLTMNKTESYAEMIDLSEGESLIEIDEVGTLVDDYDSVSDDRITDEIFSSEDSVIYETKEDNKEENNDSEVSDETNQSDMNNGERCYTVSESVLEFMKKSQDEIVFCSDLYSINREPLFCYVVFVEGYCIYYKNNDHIIEFSNSANKGPYQGYEKYDKFYIGPMEYIYHNEDTYRYIHNDEEIDIDQFRGLKYPMYEVQDKRNSINKATNVQKTRTLNMAENTVIPNDEIKYDKKSIKGEGDDIDDSDDKINPYGIKKMPFGDNNDNTCGILAASMLLVYYDHNVCDLVDDDKDPFINNVGNISDELYSYLKYNYRIDEVSGNNTGTYPWEDSRLLNNYLGNERPNSSIHAQFSYTGSEIIKQINNDNPVAVYGQFDYDPHTAQYDSGEPKNRHVIIVFGYAYSAASGIYYRCHYGWHNKDFNDVWISSEMYLIGGIVYLEQTEPHKHISGHIYDADLLDMNGRHLYSCAHPNCNTLMSDDCPDDYRFAETIEPKFTSETPDYHFGGKIDRKDDTDVYRFSLSETMYLSCEMDFDRQGEVGIYDKDYNLIQGRTAAARRQICNLLLDRGVYYISIKANDEQGYAGDIRYSQYDIEGDSKEAPYSLALNGTVQAHAGRVDKANDEDWLSFDVPYKSHVTVVTKAGGNNLMMRIYDGNNATLVTVNSNNVQKEAAMNHRLLDAGKYYIRVSSPNLQSYDVNVSIDTQEDTDADSLNEAKEIKSINSDGQTVYRKERSITQVTRTVTILIFLTEATLRSVLRRQIQV